MTSPNIIGVLGVTCAIPKRTEEGGIGIRCLQDIGDTLQSRDGGISELNKIYGLTFLEQSTALEDIQWYLKEQPNNHTYGEI